MSKQRNIRKRRAVDSEDEAELDLGADGEEHQPLSAEEIKLMQKQRHRKTVGMGSIVGESTRASNAGRRRCRRRCPCVLLHATHACVCSQPMLT